MMCILFKTIEIFILTIIMVAVLKIGNTTLIEMFQSMRWWVSRKEKRTLLEIFGTMIPYNNQIDYSLIENFKQSVVKRLIKMELIHKIDSQTFAITNKGFELIDKLKNKK